MPRQFPFMDASHSQTVLDAVKRLLLASAQAHTVRWAVVVVTHITKVPLIVWKVMPKHLFHQSQLVVLDQRCNEICVDWPIG